jgi:3'-phosphoadenosine 5'-phosphosulfate sulfotransferase (PAPS reductase)/FAD synthetase
MLLELWQLKQRQSLRLDEKIAFSRMRIREWYEHWGDVHVSFSGGKDSTVLLHMVREMYPSTPALFIDTGLEYPEIKEFVKTVGNVITLRPKKSFKQVLEEYGFPVASKKTARFIRDLQNPTDKNIVTRNLRITGMTGSGKYSPSLKLAAKWFNLANSDIKVSEQCCDVMKKEPFKRYEKETGSKPMCGVMAGESKMREARYLETGCNAFHNTRGPISMPLSIWNEEDIWAYKEKFGLEFSKIYETESRTGCMFCMFGVHLEQEPNRFQRMQRTHEKLWKYCMYTLGCGKVLDKIGVPWKNQPTLFDS